MEIDPVQAEHVRWMHEGFAAGRSSIDLAHDLNRRSIPGPRGGQWNASTIRGNPKTLVGIINNPPFRGELVWKRREWRKDPDSDRRERRYRLRDKDEWIRVAVPDLRIVDEGITKAVDEELARRTRTNDPARLHQGNRSRHLLSGRIKCGECGASFTLASRDYYACAGRRERGTCGNTVTVRVAPLEAVVLATLQNDLFTPARARIFVDEFNREVARLSQTGSFEEDSWRARLAEVEQELTHLSKNFLAGAVGPTILAMINEREAERARLQLALSSLEKRRTAPVLAHTTIVQKFEEKVAAL